MSFDDWWKTKLGEWDRGWTGWAETDDRFRCEAIARLAWEACEAAQLADESEKRAALEKRMEDTAFYDDLPSQYFHLLLKGPK